MQQQHPLHFQNTTILRLSLTSTSSSVQAAVCSQLLDEVTDRPAQNRTEQNRAAQHSASTSSHVDIHEDGCSIITGCSDGGIGAATADIYHPKGHPVSATLPQSLQKGGARLTGQGSTRRRRGPSSEPVVADLQESQCVARCAGQVVKRTGHAAPFDVLRPQRRAHNVPSSCPLLIVGHRSGSGRQAGRQTDRLFFDVSLGGVLASARVFAPLLVRAERLNGVIDA